MASPSETQSAYEIAARALPAIRRLLPDVGPVRTLQDFLDQLGAAETDAQRAYEKLVLLRRDGLDRREDYIIYRKLQDEMYRAQIAVLSVVRTIAGPLAPAIASQLPVPTPLPSLTWESRHASQVRQGVAGMAGLGFLPIVAAVVAALIALGLAYLLSDEIEAIFEDLATVVLARGRAAQQTQLIEERRRAFDACLAAGGSRSSCTSEAAALVPTPTEAGTEMPDLPGSGGGSSPLRTLLWVGLGVVVLTGLGAGLIYAFGGRSSGYYGMGGYRNVPHRATGKLPARVADLDGSKSRYFLEV